MFKHWGIDVPPLTSFLNFQANNPTYKNICSHKSHLYQHDLNKKNFFPKKQGEDIFFLCGSSLNDICLYLKQKNTLDLLQEGA